MNQLKEKTIKKIVAFCKVELCIMDSVTVEVHLKDLTKDNAYGWCYKKNNKPYKIEIEKTLTKDEMLVILCHEMVHVRQYSEGDRSNEREAEELEVELVEKYKLIVKK
jgi:hypothetical protein